MERFATGTRKKSLATEVRAWAEKYADRGATVFFRSTVKDGNMAIPQTALEMAYYLAADSPKLQVLSGLINDVVLTRKKQTILVFNSSLISDNPK
jgi:hypothetical protein